MNLQHRTFDGFVVKSIGGTESDMIFEGYGSVFNNIDSYGDTIVPGAFSKSIERAHKEGRWPAMLLQHGGGMFASSVDMTPIGIWTEMEEDDHGLKLTGKLANTERGREAYTLLKMEPRPAITGLSIGFIIDKSKPGEGVGQADQIIQEVDLWETSLVTFPANDEARVSQVKSIQDLRTLQEIERYLREAYGASRAEAKSLVTGIKSCLREADENQAALKDSISALERNLKILRGE
jgi:HK97 family phage prohead protease